MAKSSLEQTKRKLRLRKSTSNKREFSNMRNWFPALERT